MPVEEATKFFENQKKIQNSHSRGCRFGIYSAWATCNHPIRRRSAESKPVTELHRPARNYTVYILDEPTTGLAMSDVHQLIDVPVDCEEMGILS